VGVLDKTVLQTEANPAAHQDHVVDPLANNSVPGDHISPDPKDDANLNKPSSMSMDNDIDSTSIEMPQVNRLKKSNMHGARMICVTEDKRRVCGCKRIHTSSQYN